MARSTTRFAASTELCLAATIFIGQRAPWSTPAPVLRHPVQLGPAALQGQDHLCHLMLHLRVVGHRAGEGQRGALVGPLHGQVEGPLGQPVVDVGEPHPRPGEDAQDEGVRLPRRELRAM